MIFMLVGRFGLSVALAAEIVCRNRAVTFSTALVAVTIGPGPRLVMVVDSCLALLPDRRPSSKPR